MIKEAGKQATKFVVKNAPTILAVFGAAGVVFTAVAAGKATIKAKKILDEMPEDADTKEKARVIAPIMAKPFLLGAATIFCILEGDHIHVRRNAALAACYTLSQKAFDEYEQKVIETIGKKKEQKIRDSVAEDSVNKNPPPDDLIKEGDGKILCFDKWSGRYFRTQIEKIDEALNYINFILTTEGYCSLNEWYEKLGLEGVEAGENMGWNRDTDGLVSMEPSWAVTSMLYKDKYPVRVLVFHIKPKEYFYE